MLQKRKYESESETFQHLASKHMKYTECKKTNTKRLPFSNSNYDVSNSLSSHIVSHSHQPPGNLLLA